MSEQTPHYWYETQERAFAPGIADGWPKVIPAPHTKNGRLVRRDGDPSDLLAALKEVLEGLDEYWQAENLNALARAEAAIAKAEGR